MLHSISTSSPTHPSFLVLAVSNPTLPMPPKSLNPPISYSHCNIVKKPSKHQKASSPAVQRMARSIPIFASLYEVPQKSIAVCSTQERAVQGLQKVYKTGDRVKQRQEEPYVPKGMLVVNACRFPTLSNAIYRMVKYWPLAQFDRTLRASWHTTRQRLDRLKPY